MFQVEPRSVRGCGRGGGGGGLGGLKHPLGSGVVLVKCPNSKFFSLVSGDGPREMPKSR